MEFCQNCQKELAVEKYPLHLNYCRRNIKKCSQCSRPYDINYEQQHRQQFHQFQACKHCGVQLSSQSLNSHMQECMEKPDVCVYCELPVPKSKSEEHRALCEARTKTCEKCNKPVTNKDYFDHVSQCRGSPAVSYPQQNNYPTYSNLSSASYPNSIPYYSSQSQTIQSSPSYSSTTSSSSFTYQNSQANPVTRTYTRTYYQNPDGTTYGHQIIENGSYGNAASSSSATTSSTYSTSAGSSSNGNVISQRVISRRVINHPYTPITPTGTTIPQQVTLPSSYSSQSEYYGAFNDEDNDLQLALMASLDCYDENSAELYKQIQQQAALEKQFKK